jgi:hypothetical protein
MTPSYNRGILAHVAHHVATNAQVERASIQSSAGHDRLGAAKRQGLTCPVSSTG